MSSAASQSPDFSKSPADPPAETASLKTPPKRPTLVSPPQRPTKPTPTEREQAAEPTTPTAVRAQPQSVGKEEPQAEAADAASQYQPIAPPSEPMQYRAIGLIRGTYTPEDEQFNRGLLATEDGVTIEAVLLGRITSLVKKHLDLQSPHLWVVYPRTRKADDEEEDQDLHVQIVGVWEPETLGLPGEGVESESEENSAAEGEDKAEEIAEQTTEAVEPAAEAEKPKMSLADLPPVNENYFSIRGEIVRYEEDQQIIIVKILQGLKRPPASRKAFRLLVQGTLQGRSVGYFWDLNVKREAKTLVLERGSAVGIVPPKKRKGGGGGPGGRRSGPPRRGGPGGGPGGGSRPFSPRPINKGARPAPPSKPSEGSPVPKPKPAE
ncbi:MAG: hypothetical protein ICV77_00640 [Cyanobacteria bacterium Co-bin8]|nr:hypothetical protein [Cyanobacteria bacterium Co-bin8]